MRCGAAAGLNINARTVSAVQVRVVERSIEGRHSTINTVLKRAPHASVCYLSLELRFCHLQELAATNPTCMAALQQRLRGLETADGLRHAVMQLGLQLASLCLQIASQCFLGVCWACMTKHANMFAVLGFQTWSRCSTGTSFR